VVVPITVLAAVVGFATVGRIADGAAPAVPVAPITAAVDRLSAPVVAPVPIVVQRRETGTDGLMGRLPFNLPPDEIRPIVNRFRIDDVVLSWPAWDTTPPWVRRSRSRL
jgi:hypothetical protein